MEGGKDLGKSQIWNGKQSTSIYLLVVINREYCKSLLYLFFSLLIVHIKFYVCYIVREGDLWDSIIILILKMKQKPRKIN